MAWEYGDVTDPDTWYEDLNMGKKTIYVWLALSAGCCVLAYFFVGPVAREILALGIAIGFQLVSTPELLKNPGAVFKKNWKMVSAGRADDDTIIFYFVWLIIIFFFVMMLANIQVYLSQKRESETGFDTK